MAKNRALMERWRKEKQRKRRTKPKSFSNKAYGIIDRGSLNEAGVNAYGHRARSFQGDFDFLSFLFTFPDNPTVRPMDDPRLAVEYKIEYLKQQDPLARVLEFTCIFLEGSGESERALMFFFRGLECFFVSRDVSIWKRTIIYGDVNRAKHLHNCGRLKWLPPIITPSDTSNSVDSLS